MSVDLELAMTGAEADSLRDIQESLPDSYYAEDRSDKGWGLAIRSATDMSGNCSDAIRTFLEPLNPLTDWILAHDGIMRVGIFHVTVNCTIHLDCCGELARLGLLLEVSTYPSVDDG